MRAIEIRRPTAADTATIKAILKAAGVKISVKKITWMITIGRQCQRLSEETARTILTTLKSAGYLIDMKDTTEQLISKGICDVICVEIPE